MGIVLPGKYFQINKESHVKPDVISLNPVLRYQVGQVECFDIRLRVVRRRFRVTRCFGLNESEREADPLFITRFPGRVYCTRWYSNQASGTNEPGSTGSFHQRNREIRQPGFPR